MKVTLLLLSGRRGDNEKFLSSISFLYKILVINFRELYHIRQTCQWNVHPFCDIFAKNLEIMWHACI